MSQKVRLLLQSGDIGLLIARDINGFGSDISPNGCDPSCCCPKQCTLPYTCPWGCQPVYLTLFKGLNHSICSGCPQDDGDMVCKLGRTTGHERNLVLIVTGYPIDLHTHNNISYWPPFIIERLVNSYTPLRKSVRGPIWSPRATTHSGVIMLTFAPVSKRTGIHFPLIIVYPTLSLPNQ